MFGAIVDLPFAVPTAVAGIALTALYAPNGWIGSIFALIGVKIAYTPIGITIALIAVGLPFVVRTVQPVMEEISREIEEAAELDGLDSKRIFFKIVLPLSAPGVVATALLSFVFAWNDFLFANILSGATTRTATVGLTEFVTPVGTAWTTIMAAGTIVVIPVWIAALFAQKYLVRGLTMGSVK